MSENKLIVGIPVYNDKEALIEMIQSLMESTRAFDKILIVESESTDGAKELCEDLARSEPKVELIQTPKEGPLKAYNLLFEIAKKEKADLFLTQSDVLFPRLYRRDWLEIMKEISQDKNIGAVTCLNGGGISGSDYIDGFRWLGGWCTYYPNRTIEKIGGFDETFPNGYGVDIDHSYRIQKEGLKVFYMKYWVDHHMSNERAHDRDPKTEEMKKESSKYFKKKWKIQ